MDQIERHREHFAGLIERLESTGCAPVVLIGAGEFVRRLRPRLLDPDGRVTHIVDDDPRKIGARWAGLPVVGVEEAIASGARGAIITAEDAAQDALWAKRRTFVEAGMRVLACPDRFADLPWDRCLIDFYDWRLARDNGRHIPYLHEYPEPDVEPSQRTVALARQGLPERASICEIGPGAGLWTEQLISDASAFHAVDFSARLLHEAIEHRFRRHLDKLHLHHDTTARLAGVPDQSIDLVFSYDVFVHLKPDAVHQFLASIRRVLRPGAGALLHFRDWDDAEITRWEEQFAAAYVGEGTMMHYNSLDSLRASAARLGLRVERVGDGLCYGYLARFSRIEP